MPQRDQLEFRRLTAQDVEHLEGLALTAGAVPLRHLPGETRAAAEAEYLAEAEAGAFRSGGHRFRAWLRTATGQAALLGLIGTGTVAVAELSRRHPDATRKALARALALLAEDLADEPSPSTSRRLTRSERRRR